MREVTASRVVDASPAELSARLDPPTIVEAEGSFTVESVHERDGATVVVAGGPGLQVPLRFEDRESELYYTQEGDGGPFSHLETWLDLEPVDGGSGTRVLLRSTVSLAVSLPFTDRIAAWKRRGELERALDHIATEFA
ncbi:SRPBCC family protein [Halopiger aswanensis]|uniref:Polyketide cyclase/dehydrase/lipid transport protein n=1 Tax=Halopiger aswanensis TaxID=148449 RepID=A0A419WS31_9EURY|nr:SRPBCC family protein [Halopiger aswanensis]RKD98216.1 hypothetical protein ATJ93_1221 [Halopiger aswanensis]